MSTTPSFEVVPISEIAFRGGSEGNGYRSLSRSGLGRPVVGGGPVVLVVDDERIIADTLTTILTRSGFAVMTAYDGVSALELARLVPPELLLTDCMMYPGMNGVQLGMAVANEVPDCRVLVFSGQAGTLDLLEMARERGHEFGLLPKPVHPTELLAKIFDVLGAERQHMAVSC